MQTNIPFWLVLTYFFSEWELFQTKVIDKIKHFLCWKVYFQKLVPFMRCQKHGKTREATHDNMAHAYYMLDS